MLAAALRPALMWLRGHKVVGDSAGRFVWNVLFRYVSKRRAPLNSVRGNCCNWGAYCSSKVKVVSLCGFLVIY